MKRIYIIFAVLLCSSFFQACGKADFKEEDKAEASAEASATASAEASAVTLETVATDALAENPDTLQEKLMGIKSEENETELQVEENDIKSSSFWEADGYIYALSDRQISRIDMDTGKSVVLWNNWEKEEKPDFTVYARGGGILYKDKFYFLETTGENAAVSVIGVDGTGYRRLIPMGSVYGYRMYLKNNTFYVYQKWIMKGVGYELEEDGSLRETENKFPYQEVLEKAGYSAGEINHDYLLSIDHFYSEDEKALYLTNIRTMETEFLAACGQNTSTIDMDESYLYIRRTDAEETMDIYEKISLESGEISEMFHQKKPEYKPDTYWTPDGTMNLSVQNGYLYYPQMEDYRLYVMRRKIADPQKTEKVGEAFYDTGISGIGGAKELQEEIYSQSYPDIPLLTSNIWCLTVDGHFVGADQINQILDEEEVEDAFNLSKEDIEYLESEIREYGDCTSWYYNSRFSQVFCLKDRLFSFYQYGCLSEGTGLDRYFRRGHTFDLQSGEALSLWDVIQNSEKELKDIIMRYAVNAGMEWEGILEDDLKQMIEETDLSWSFYLTEQGIVFYFSFGEPVYNDEFIQMMVPYSEFNMKIDTGK